MTSSKSSAQKYLPTIKEIINKKRPFAEVINEDLYMACSQCAYQFKETIRFEDAADAFRNHFTSNPRCQTGVLVLTLDIVRNQHV